MSERDAEADRGAGRRRASADLDRAALPRQLPYGHGEWPIAGAMLQFPASAPDGRSVAEAGPDDWHAALLEIRNAGFDAVEISSAWLPTSELSPGQLIDLRQVLDSLALRLVGTLIVRRSIIDPDHGTEHLALTHRAVDAAATLGAPILCLGLHETLRPSQQDATWFWTRPGAANPDDPGVRDRAVQGFREIARHAEAVGVRISLELYEDTYLGDGDSAVRFLADIDRPNVGLNPDIGNLIRQQRSVESWEALVVKTLPFANYWHVKNYLRLEAPEQGLVLTAPATLATGIVNYRKAVRYALSVGFAGAFVVEHYGGDGLGVGAMNRDYLRSILP